MTVPRSLRLRWHRRRLGRHTPALRSCPPDSLRCRWIGAARCLAAALSTAPADESADQMAVAALPATGEEA